MNWKNTLTETLKTEYPIIQAPMLGVTTPAMVAAISNAGGLGSLPVGGLSPDKTRELIRQTKALTSNPFAVNLFAHAIPTINRDEADTMQQFLEKLSTENGLPFTKQNTTALRFYHYTEQVEILIEENIPVVSFTFGVLNDEVIKALKQKGVVLIGTATSLQEALVLDQKQIDIISAQGIEAGGHRGSFLENIELPMINASALVPQIVNSVNRPVIWAGGICDGKTMKAAFAAGAKGVQPGTAFIACTESAAIPAYKTALQNATETSTTLTRAFSGRWARGIRNIMMTAIENSGLSIPPYPIQNTLTGLLRAEAQKQNNPDFTNLWAGQSACKAEAKPAQEIFRSLIRQAEAQD